MPYPYCRVSGAGLRARKGNVWGRRGIANVNGQVDKKLVEKLPLAGIRVLDMTRVLAGVYDHSFPVY